MPPKTKIDVHEIVTNKIVAALESGTVPWRKPWKDIGGIPVSMSSGKAYRGVNIWTLIITSWAEGYSSPFWGTYKQILARGGFVRKGEKGTQIIIYKPWYSKKNAPEDEKEKRGVFMQTFTVFNEEQADGLDLPKADVLKEFTPLEQGEAVIKAMPQRPEIRHGGNRAYYDFVADFVGLPKKEQFEETERYYLTAFHELVHSTGWTDRIGRDLDGFSMNPDSYSKEELIAELGASFLAGECGIETEDTVEQSAAYCKAWLDKIGGDRSLMVSAAAAAAKATDFILGRKYGDAPKVEMPLVTVLPDAGKVMA